MSDAPTRPSGVPSVKICGLGREEEVEAAAGAGAGYAGFVLAESPRRVDPSRAARLAAAARAAGLEPVGVFVDEPAGEIARAAEAAGFTVAQLHGAETPGTCATVRRRGLEVWKAVRPRSREELAGLVARFRDAVDALLVEGWSADRVGGTGTALPHEWIEAGEGSPRPRRLVLAGGLDPENVGEAVRRVRPDVVDVSSGVEASPGRKDPDRIRAFVRAVRQAAAGADG